MKTFRIIYTALDGNKTVDYITAKASFVAIQKLKNKCFVININDVQMV